MHQQIEKMRRLLLVIMLAILLLQGATISAQGAERGRLYAVLINGGRNRLTNHERYWNDCAFLYRTLRQTFHIPKRNITVLMSDGGLSGDDMLREDGRGFVSSPVDLDGDGQSDVDYAATREVLVNVMLNMSRRLTSDDHLYLFIVDHGGSTDRLSDSFIWLWNDDKMEDYTLGSLLGLFQVASINVLMGQCYSGGFIDNLMRNGLVIATACSGNEQSWVSPDRPYDEFVYHWTCAVNEADTEGNTITADADGDGQVSMAEAFAYARSHDRVNESPQYASWPEELGEQWTFGNANNGTLGIKEVRSDEMESDRSSDIWTVSGVRQQNAKAHAVYIERRGGKIRKIVR